MTTQREYRQLPGRDVCHFHPRCQHWRWTLWKGEVWFQVKVRTEKPTSGELCNECQAKTRRDAK